MTNKKYIDEIKPIGQWLELIKKFRMSPHEALEHMERKNQDIKEVLEYLKVILRAFNSHPMNRKKLGKVKDLLDDERYM